MVDNRPADRARVVTVAQVLAEAWSKELRMRPGVDGDEGDSIEDQKNALYINHNSSMIKCNSLVVTNCRPECKTTNVFPSAINKLRRHQLVHIPVVELEEQTFQPSS